MATVAGIEVGLPGSIDEVTPEWLTTVLRTSGALGADGSVVGVELAPFAEGLGFLSLLHRATLRYDGQAGDAPATLIVKMVTDLEAQRGIAEALQFYERELRFYREIAPQTGYRSPRAHAAMMAETSTDFVLVMEDLSDLRGLDQGVGVSVDDALLAASTMARQHAAFAGRDLADIETTFLPFDNPIYRAALPSVFEGGWENCKAEAADLLTPEVIAFGDRFGEVVPFFCDQFQSTTLIHGDWRADNLLVDERTGEMVVIDFQIMGTGPLSYDLGYFMSQSMEPEIRAGARDAIIERYFATLAESGADVDRDEELNRFRLVNAWCFIYPVSTFTAWGELLPTQRDTARQMLRRSVNALLDEDALSLIPD